MWANGQRFHVSSLHQIIDQAFPIATLKNTGRPGYEARPIEYVVILSFFRNKGNGKLIFIASQFHNWRWCPLIIVSLRVSERVIIIYNLEIYV